MFKKINLKGKTALVTGAGKGLGKACAIALAEAGAKVIIISRTKKNVFTGYRSSHLSFPSQITVSPY